MKEWKRAWKLSQAQVSGFIAGNEGTAHKIEPTSRLLVLCKGYWTWMQCTGPLTSSWSVELHPARTFKVLLLEPKSQGAQYAFIRELQVLEILFGILVSFSARTPV